nr:NAD-dependent succinate-semialdehyde dehydrogenase [Flavilitoribacter nigricans]
MMKVINPATAKVEKTYSNDNKSDVAEKIKAAHQEQQSWREESFLQRAESMMRAADILEERKEAFAELMTTEMGKLYRDAIAEAEKCAWVCRYYAEHAAGFLTDEVKGSDATRSYVSFEPLGVILAIMPWNFPFWQVFRCAAPAIMAGNTVLLKHASNVPGCAMAIESIFRDAGFPKGVFQTLLIDSDATADVIAAPEVKAVSLTGSEAAGRAVAGLAGKHLKKAVLELGGSDPYLILGDADLEQAAEVCAKGRLLNNGQSCIGAKRFIIVDRVYDDFVRLFKGEMEAAVMGDPMKDGVDLGPMARTDLRDDLHEQVTKSIRKGAKCILGGEIPDREGAYYPATILTEVAPGQPAYEEELFGPVASVIRVADEPEAVRVANDTPFGLGAAIFTRDTEAAERIARSIAAGSVFINTMVKSDPRLPFGGIKNSGYGRELSDYGIREFVNIKTIYVK